MNILSLSGFIPEAICDTKRFTGYQGNQVISHYCGYGADYISQVLDDPEIDGAVFPRSCDSCRVMGSYLSGAQGKFIYQFAVPARQDSSAVEYLAGEIQRYQTAVEQHYRIKITDIPQRIQMINKRNQTLRKLYQNLDQVSYFSYLKMIEEMLNTPLSHQSIADQLPGKPDSTGKSVYLVGSFLSDIQLTSVIENSGLAIVGDNLTGSKRLFFKPDIALKGDIYTNIAQSMLSGPLSPTQDHFQAILEQDLLELRQKEVRGVLFITQKYCEPYDYLFSVYKKVLDREGIPALRLALSNSNDNRKLAFALEAFSDIL